MGKLLFKEVQLKKVCLNVKTSSPPNETLGIRPVRED